MHTPQVIRYIFDKDNRFTSIEAWTSERDNLQDWVNIENVFFERYGENYQTDDAEFHKIYTWSGEVTTVFLALNKPDKRINIAIVQQGTESGWFAPQIETREQYIPGDLNFDGKEDSEDENIFQQALGGCIGDGNYCRPCDDDRDGCVTEKDREILFPSKTKEKEE